MFTKILLTVGLGIFLLAGCFYFKKNNTTTSNPTDMSNTNDLPIVKSITDVKEHAEKEVLVEGIYELKDMRMRRVNPPNLFKGHVEIVFEDNYSAILLPPDNENAIRPEEEQTKYKGKKVRVRGTIYPYIPEGESNLDSPCLLDIKSIELVD